MGEPVKLSAALIERAEELWFWPGDTMHDEEWRGQGIHDVLEWLEDKNLLTPDGVELAKAFWYIYIYDDEEDEHNSEEKEVGE